MLYPISILNPNGVENFVGFIDANGRVIVQPSYKGGSFFFEGKGSVIDTNGKSGFIDSTGTLLIPCRFEGLGYFKDGLCSIWGGYIDHAGRWFIEPQFLVASHFSGGRAFASKDGETFGFIDLTGKFVNPPQPQVCSDFSDGLAAVRRDERWGYLDYNGEIKIPFVFEGPRAPIFRNGVAGVQIDGRYGFIDHSGDFVLRPEYEDIKSFSEGYAPVRQRGKWGMINSEGRIAVDCRFDDLGELKGGLAFAKVDGRVGFISSSGSWVIQPEFDKCYPFFGALAVVRNVGGSYSYVRRNGEAVWTSEAGARIEVPYLVRSA